MLVLLAKEEKTQHESSPHSSPIPQTNETARRLSKFPHMHQLLLKISKSRDVLCNNNNNNNNNNSNNSNLSDKTIGLVLPVDQSG